MGWFFLLFSSKFFIFSVRADTCSILYHVHNYIKNVGRFNVLHLCCILVFLLDFLDSLFLCFISSWWVYLRDYVLILVRSNMHIVLYVVEQFQFHLRCNESNESNGCIFINNFEYLYWYDWSTLAFFILQVVLFHKISDNKKKIRSNTWV